jgi:hypothetical protein
MYVTDHAIARYQDRIDPRCDPSEAREAIRTALGRSRPYDRKSGSVRQYDSQSRAFYVIKQEKVVTVEIPFWLK